MPKKVLISGGGTGGHVFPAIAIGQELKRRLGDEVELLFVGAKGRMEEERVPKAGFDIKVLPIKGLSRSKIWSNWNLPIMLVRSWLMAKKIIAQFRPDAVIGVGGYASGVVVRMAAGQKIATVIQEQNSYAGLTNKLLSKHVDKICVAFEGMSRFFDSDKIVLTGNPVRKEFKASIDRSDALAHFELQHEKAVVLVIGGSLGAHSFNQALMEGYEKIACREDVQILWQCGKGKQGAVESRTAGLRHVSVRPFIDRMDYAIAAADVVVSRAGAMTLSELAIMQKPAIIVPSPNVVDDHQTKNAQALVDSEACVLVKDEDADKLVDELYRLVDDANRRTELSEEMAKHGKMNAEEVIVSVILDLIDKKKSE